jgi:hypothetical protein
MTAAGPPERLRRSLLRMRAQARNKRCGGYPTTLTGTIDRRGLVELEMK